MDGRTKKMFGYSFIFMSIFWSFVSGVGLTIIVLNLEIVKRNGSAMPHIIFFSLQLLLAFFLVKKGAGMIFESKLGVSAPFSALKPDIHYLLIEKVQIGPQWLMIIIPEKDTIPIIVSVKVRPLIEPGSTPFMVVHTEKYGILKQGENNHQVIPF